jgi:integrase
MTFQFFLGTGFREQEVMFCSWKNVDFKGKVVAVRSKPEMGFRPKDKEERSVPVPDSLIAALANRKKESTSMFIFPGCDGKPNGHFLRMLQKLALRAGLNCGECLTKDGKSCATQAICREWGLHKFRKTFATMHNEAGVPPPSKNGSVTHHGSPSDSSSVRKTISMCGRFELAQNSVIWGTSLLISGEALVSPLRSASS